MEIILIKIDGKVYATFELAMPFFSLALEVDLYNLPLVTAVPELPVATYVDLYNLPLVKTRTVKL